MEQISERTSKGKSLQEALREKLLAYEFSHFITLASNHQPLSLEAMRSLLKQWDARVNRDLNGPKWAKRPDERLLWWAFPEKVDVNPHWHLLAQVDPRIEETTRKARAARLDEFGEKHWLQLVPRGSFDCQAIDSFRVNNYVTKMSSINPLFENFVVHTEFATN